MTKIFDHTNHTKLWMWLSENPKKKKEDWPKWKTNYGTIESVHNDCFACEYDESFFHCNGCPLVWPDNKNINADDCMGLEGLFFRWDTSKDNHERSKLALQIANLPVRHGVITK
jgi:hypothetical protein